MVAFFLELYKNPIMRGKVTVNDKDQIEQRLLNGESLRSIAKSLNTTYQSLQYHRELWGCTKLKPSLRKGPNHPNWRGGVSVARDGYRLIYSPERTKAHPYTYEHVLVAEKMIGRRLQKGEHVHHINGDKLDNRPENLFVGTASQHRLLHRGLEVLAMQLVRSGQIIFDGTSYHWR